MNCPLKTAIHHRVREVLSSPAHITDVNENLNLNLIIALTIVRNAQIASVDTKTEYILQENFHQYFSKRTVTTILAKVVENPRPRTSSRNFKM